ncbi:MAG TPA: cysteine--tRNA ligase [Thermomicrobiales bacterium]|nr:cysteine--tRNA ligase [Thermomicrobiales bacterium]
MTLTVYNTMTRSKEPFTTIEPGVARMYVCGVTVYSDAHIGHAMSVITFDMIRRYLEWTGYTVIHAQNFTDVDDKIIIRAAELGIDPDELTERLIDEWMIQTGELNALPATVYPRATREIPGIIEMISHLMEDGHAYFVEGGDVNYRVNSFKQYGKLSHRKLDDMLAGARVEIDPRKEHPMDFVLWKASKPGEPSWDSPWGRGRPGWHIECSVMALNHLGRHIDIHGGGADLIFPHHENEIAQTEAFPENRPFARYWMHNGLLQLGGEKMSKSIGNLISVSDLIHRRQARAFRLMVLQSIYRNPLVYSDDALAAAARGLERLDTAALGFVADPASPDDDTSVAIADADARFRAAMDDDFNTPVAVSVVFDLARLANRATGANRAAAQHRLITLASVLGLELQTEPDDRSTGDAAPFIDLILKVRDELRGQRLFALSDMIRDELAERGVIVEDSSTGAIWRREE